MFDIFGVSICMVEDLIGVTLWGFKLGEAAVVAMTFIKDTSVMCAGKVLIEEGYSIRERRE